MKTIVVSPELLKLSGAWEDQPRIEIFYAWGRLVLVGAYIKTFLDWFSGFGSLSFLTLLSRTEEGSSYIRIRGTGVTVYRMCGVDLDQL